MKKLIAISAFCFSLSAFATTVLFPLQLMTGNKHNRTILIQPDISTNQVVNGTNLVGLLPVTVTPTNGVGRAALLPWSYTVRVDGWPKSFHILVPDSTNTLNAVDLITNTVAIGTPVQLLTSVAVSNSATVTWTGNGTSTNPLVAEAVGGLTNNQMDVTLGGNFLYPAELNYIGQTHMTGTNLDGFPVLRYPNGDLMAESFLYPNGPGYLVGCRFYLPAFNLFYETTNGFTGGSSITFTNATGARFMLIVNASTNGFTFVPVP